MGASGRDDDSWGGGRTPRRNRSEDDGFGGRSSSRGGDQSYRSGGRGRGEGDLRGSSGNWERRGSSRDGSARDDRGGSAYSNGGRNRPPADYDRYDRGGPPGRSARDPRGDYDARMQDRSRSARGPRDDTWDAPRGRSGMNAAGASGMRNRAPARGIWDEDDRRPRRQDVGDFRGRGASARDPRLQGRGMARGAVEEDEDESSFTAGKAALTVLVILLLSVGAAVAYFKVSTPHVPASLISPTTVPTQVVTASPAVSPSAAATGTP